MKKQKNCHKTKQNCSITYLPSYHIDAEELTRTYNHCSIFVYKS